MASKKKRLSLIGRYVDTFFPLREELTGERKKKRWLFAQYTLLLLSPSILHAQSQAQQNPTWDSLRNTRFCSTVQARKATTARGSAAAASYHVQLKPRQS